VFVGDKEKNEMWSKYLSGMKSPLSLTGQGYEKAEEMVTFSVPMDKSIVGECFLKGEILNIPDVNKHEKWAKKKAKNTGFRCQSILCAPVKNKEGEVVAVVEFLNKKSKKGEPERSFDENDEKLAKMLAHHTALFMEKVEEDE